MLGVDRATAASLAPSETGRQIAGHTLSAAVPCTIAGRESQAAVTPVAAAEALAASEEGLAYHANSRNTPRRCIVRAELLALASEAAPPTQECQRSSSRTDKANTVSQP